MSDSLTKLSVIFDHAKKTSKIDASRKAWKDKAKDRKSKIADLKKTLRRQEQRRIARAAERVAFQRLLKENAELRALLAKNGRQLPPKSQQPIAYRTLCVLILRQGIVPFRSVPRILKIFQPLLQYPIKIPHFTSVIHWTLRAGVALITQVAPIAEPWVALIDCSIDIGTRKALVVLRVPLRALHQKGSALGLDDCECVGLEISPTWNGPRVCEALGRIFSAAGIPAAILKDGGSDLKKGVELFSQQHPGHPIQILEDVGHSTANLLKARFGKTRSFAAFLAIVSRGASRIRQTDLAWLLPPKIRTKGRFQGITEIANWARRVLELLGKKPRTGTSAEVEKLHQAFAGLGNLRPFLSSFFRACTVTEHFLKLMKNHGLNETTYREAQELLAPLSPRSTLRKGLSRWLDRHLTTFRALGMAHSTLPISSDPIESLFGKFKTIIQRNPHAELNRLVFVIPLLCGRHSASDIDQALAQCPHAQMLSQIEKIVPPTLRQIRAKKLKTTSISGPKTGDFSSNNSA